ncbi:DNA topoisomerase 2-alpha [Dermacentor silvarum]|uniref:DNA topoisomerase 2-alpha n=1 Tax=Dermacentor silvarum TaxID=543639 RepID=UPI00189A2830|nr:DNA topoisomerase 2-alpha [Dermacentor silvarum]
MSSDGLDDLDSLPVAGDIQQNGEAGGANKGAKGRLSVERIYQKKSQLEHILLRPDTYIGSVEPVTQNMWVYDGEENGGMKNRSITFVPGLYKIFDEILVNAADNKQRDKTMDCIKIEIDADQNRISVWNNGKGIPVVEHKVEKMFVPTLIFGHLLTSSNYNDEEKKVTGGRNGYGAKLCNIFSTKFTVETYSRSEKKIFKQVWEDNMKKTTDPKIRTEPKGEDFTKITFQPDLAKFKMDKLDADTVALLSRRAYDVAGCTRGVKVYLNGKRLPVKGFKDYVQLFVKDKEDEAGNPLTVVYESANDRWEVAVTLSEAGEFRQMSFVNSIATTKGGSHVDYVADQIVKKVLESVKKKNKAGVKIQNKQIKDHLWVFVNCLIENPTFDSQTKENMTLQMKKFGSKCELSDKFNNQVLKCGVVEAVMSWVQFKAQKQLGQKCSAKKHSKLKGIPKLEDANDAGTRNSVDCTLILTEGDSAKSLAVSGLAVVGRDKFGVFPLKGKILNVREATHKQILENAEINNVIKIMGLQYKKKYESVEDLKTLRYGRLMIMTDQDQDGSHIKGLLINFIHHNWPSLLKLPFLEEFITPIVKATKGKTELSFYSLPEFEEWKTNTDDWQRWKVKYYKGLGTSTAKEAKEYFIDMARHRIKFKYQGGEDDRAIELAFSKKMIDQRKEWLRNGMEERKQRRELGLPEVYLYGKDTRNITYEDFVNKELILFSNMDNERSIPSLVDGLKPGQRKVLYTCFKRNDKREIKVAQLAGSVAEHSAYHHGEVSLMSTIINLAQNFVGSNNINLLQPIGQFGTRLQGGKDAASPRYIFTMLSPLARLIMPASDDPVLEHLYDDNQRIEPEYYIPVLPMVLVNGAEGIGTGWSTKIPNYNPREIVANLRRMIAGEEPKPMKPWFKNFRGSVDQVEPQRFLISGEVAILSSTTIEITELPVRTWTQAYKESVLEAMLHGSEKVPPMITDYKEYHTDTTVRFVVTMTEEKLSKARDEGLHKVFKLQTSLTTSSMVLFDSKGVLTTFRTPEEILKDFFETRIEGYKKRKAYMMGLLSAEAKKLENQARFILEKIDNQIKIENRRRKEMIQTLRERGYDPDPIVEWKKQQAQQEDKQDSQDDEEEEKEEDKDGGSASYNYLLGMPMWSLTRERKEDLLAKRDQKREEVETLRRKTPENLWDEDLNAFTAKLEEVEQVERDDENSTGTKAAGLKMASGKGGRPKGGSKKMEAETQPSPFGERVEPKVDWEAKKKSEKGAGPGRKPKKSLEEGKSESGGGGGDDGDGAAPKPARKRASKGTGEKKKTPKKRRNSWSGSDTSDEQSAMSFGSDDEERPKIPPERQTSRRAALARPKYKIEDSDEEDDDDDMGEAKVNEGVLEDVEESRPSEPAASTTEDGQENGRVRGTFDSDSDSNLEPLTKRLSQGGKDNSETAFDSLFGGSGSASGSKASASHKNAGSGSDSEPPRAASKPAPAPKKAPAKRKPPAQSDSDASDVDEEEFKPKKAPVARKPAASKKKPAQSASDASDLDDDDFKPKKAAPARKPAAPKSRKKKATDSDSDGARKKAKPAKKSKKATSSDDDDKMSDKEAAGSMAPRMTTGRAKAPVKYNFGTDSSEEDF